ncbi:diacylglycerol kinase [Sulfuriferula sp. AH1]|uniref:type 3 dihydrofolate reductase n=1 Tax=Sulfuriferula sp. AH1 TaxID=1985873 RepID=UPI000B3B6983|nr:type 3 dihydrofolate reductase [Sulfuriferula sp. AH1]ARU32001.1 diacylglycerol kinase [Sulfuriferula sp. AH1]
MRPIISLIAAMAKNRVIGIRNTLPWQLPADLQHFKKLTLGHPVIMGRKTFESIGRPLPGRLNIIISRNGYKAPAECKVADSIAAAIALCAGHDEAFFIGGEQLYRQALPVADRLYLTEIDTEIEGDAWFPEFDPHDWKETQRESHYDDNNGFGYNFVIYQHKPTGNDAS